jgi:hypothetical protein
LNILIEILKNTIKSGTQLLIVLIISLYVAPALSALDTPGQSSVGLDGEANYVIPIQISSGTGGVSPILSLGYRSQAGNGVLGQGWNLNGISQISRCNKTIVQDGANGGINYDTNDRFCIDGQRLIVVSGTYGSDSAEYRTELASFSKIVSYGAAGTGPAWFKVWTKSGQIIEYGNTADSRIEAQASTSARAWGGNKISDAKGNYLTISYTEDNTTGETYIDRIDYTGNAATSPVITPFASVQFSYATRVDVGNGALIGYNNNVSKRLTNIKAYYGTTLVKDYRLTYSNNGTYHLNTSNAADGSLLTEVKECDGGSTPVCLNPINVGWTQGVANTTNTKVSFATSQSWGLPVDAEVIATGDVNGDNKDDVIYVANASGTTGTVYLAFSTGSGFGTGLAIGTVTGTWAYSGLTHYPIKLMWPRYFLADVNGDGKADLLNSNNIRLSTGSNFNAAQAWLPNGAQIAAAGDVNGDGKADALYRTSNLTITMSDSPSGSGAPLYLAISSGSAFNPGVNVASQYSWGNTSSTAIAEFYFYRISIADANGDGLGDLFNTYWARLSTGTGFSDTQRIPFNPSYATMTAYTAGDLNSDGRADVLLDFPDGTFSLTPALTKDDGVIVQPKVYPTGGTYNHGWYLSEYCDGDGESGYSCSPLDYYADIFIADVNGDGLGDLIQGSGVRLSQPSVPDFVTSITGSLGDVSTIIYKRLSDAGVYVADSDAVYPVRDIGAETLAYVVSAASSSDGIGGSVTTNYTYGGAKKNLNGRGALGFRWVKASTADSGLAVTTFKRQDFPFIGLPFQVEKRKISDNTLLSVVNTTYAQQVSAGSSFPHVTQAVDNEYEVNGALVTSTTTTYQYDTYGNVTQVVDSSNDGYSKTTTNLYLNSPTNWVIGRLLSSTVSSAAP